MVVRFVMELSLIEAWLKNDGRPLVVLGGVVVLVRCWLFVVGESAVEVKLRSNDGFFDLN